MEINALQPLVFSIFYNKTRPYKTASPNRLLAMKHWQPSHFMGYCHKKILSACSPDEIIIQDLNPENIKNRLLQLKTPFTLWVFSLF
jgi:hypothetical protein